MAFLDDFPDWTFFKDFPDWQKYRIFLVIREDFPGEAENNELTGEQHPEGRRWGGVRGGVQFTDSVY